VREWRSVRGESARKEEVGSRKDLTTRVRALITNVGVRDG